jgi:hypothetical protein
LECRVLNILHQAALFDALKRSASFCFLNNSANGGLYCNHTPPKNDEKCFTGHFETNNNTNGAIFVELLKQK